MILTATPLSKQPTNQMQGRSCVSAPAFDLDGHLASHLQIHATESSQADVTRDFSLTARQHSPAVAARR